LFFKKLHFILRKGAAIYKRGFGTFLVGRGYLPPYSFRNISAISKKKGDSPENKICLPLVSGLNAPSICAFATSLTSTTGNDNAGTPDLFFPFSIDNIKSMLKESIRFESDGPRIKPGFIVIKSQRF